MRRRSAAVDPTDVDGLVTTVVGIDRRLAQFRRRLDRFAGDVASPSDQASHRPAAGAPPSHQGSRAMPP